MSYGSLLLSLTFIVLDSRQGGVLLFRAIYLYNDDIILFIKTAVILVVEYLQVVLIHSNFNHVVIPLAIVILVVLAGNNNNDGSKNQSIDNNNQIVRYLQQQETTKDVRMKI